MQEEKVKVSPEFNEVKEEKVPICGPGGVEPKPEPADPYEGTKTAIRTIEGLFQAVNAASFPLNWHTATMNGMQFLQQLHTQLVDTLPKEEVEKIQKEIMARNAKPKPEVSK